MPPIFVTNRNLSAPSLQVRRISGQSRATEGSQELKPLRRFIGHLVARGRMDLREAVVDGNTDVETIRAALGELLPLDREALVQQVRFGRSIAQIAVALRLSETEVRVALERARRQIRTRCGEDVSGDPDS